MLTVRPTSSWMIASSAVVFFCGMAFGQQASLKNQPKAPEKNTASEAKTQNSPGKKITLLDATRVSTADALKAAAAKKAAPSAKSHNALEGIANSKAAASDSGVVELQSAGAGSLGADKALLSPSKDSKDSLLKNIHGDLYGSSAAGVAGITEESGAAGATSKGGKTSVYVQTDHSQGPLPH